MAGHSRSLFNETGGSMNEIFPITYGLIVGLICGFIGTKSWRYGCWLVLSALFGVIATVVTGESKLSWGFLLIDIPLVACSGLAMLAVHSRILCRSRTP